MATPHPKKLIDAVANNTDVEPGKRKRGRPPKDKTAVVDIARKILMGSGNAEKIANKILEIALDDENRDQFAALKFCGDRLLPQSLFEAAHKQGSSQITINVVSASPEVSIQASQVVDADDVGAEVVPQIECEDAEIVDTPVVLVHEAKTV